MTGTFRAVKVVRREDFERDKTFEREFEGIKRYEKVSQDHPGLVDVLHVGRNDEDGYYYYVMELADDQESGAEVDVDHYEPRTLASDLKSRRQRPVDECIGVGASLAEALAHLHTAGLTHRDVKPSNVIFVKGIPKLADVGLVARSGQRTFVGTEGYVPPEGPGTSSADLYSLAMVLYEMGTGKDRLDFPELPTNLELPPTVNRDEWRALNSVICRAGAPDPRKRTDSGETLARQLRRVTAGEEIPGSPWKKWAALFLVLAAAGGVTFGAYQQFFAHHEEDGGGGGDGKGSPLAGIEIPTQPEPGPHPSGAGENPDGNSSDETGGSPMPGDGPSPDPDPFAFAEMIRNPIVDGGSISAGFNGGGKSGEVIITDTEPGPPLPEPSPEPSPPPVARLKITRPPGAAVWKEDDQIAVTPTGWLEFDPGPVTLVLKKDGFLDYHYRRELDQGGNTEGSIRMKPDHRPAVDQPWKNSLGISFEYVGDRHICEEIRRDLFDRFIDETTFPYARVKPADRGDAAEDAAFADDRAMWAFCDWMTDQDRQNGYLGPEQYYAVQRFSTEGEVQAFHCVIEDGVSELRLESEPDRAEVYRGRDTYLGVTPMTLTNQRIGRHDFILKLPGHRPTPAHVETAEGEIVPLKVELDRDNSVLFGEEWDNSLGMHLVPMGDTVLVSAWETRVQDYAEFLKTDPEGIEAPKPGFEQGPDHPVAGVNAEEARRFCQWLTTEERSRNMIRSNHRYRLPTDLEWSRMAGLENEEGDTPEVRDVRQVPGHFPWGTEWPPPDGSGNFADATATRTQRSLVIANYDDGAPKTASVGSFKPNALGLFDLAGNVWEWVDDPYHKKKTPLIGVRGGGWDTFSKGNLLTSYRNAIPPDLRDGIYGFRLVLAIDPPEKSP